MKLRGEKKIVLLSLSFPPFLPSMQTALASVHMRRAIKRERERERGRRRRFFESESLFLLLLLAVLVLPFKKAAGTGNSVPET